jgi:hypothetical protein
MFYGHAELAKAALEKAVAECKRLMKPGEGGVLDLDHAGRAIFDFYKQAYANNSALERLYVTSFAKVRTDDQEQRGSLTHWARYTDHKGYCLLYEESEIRKLIEIEKTKRVYAFIELADVGYGIDNNESEFVALRDQLCLRYLYEVHSAKPGLGVDPRFTEWWPMQELATRTMKFVCRHKDPFYEDEREVRIMSLPASSVPARPFGMGLRAKPVHHAPGKRHIVLGADGPSPIEPIRIIVGRDAEKDIDGVLASFRRRPEVSYPHFPIVGA